MSLLRLLKAGRSLVNPKEPGSGYRMHQRLQLPKFGSAKNPFRARHETPAVVAAPGAILSDSPSKRDMSPAELAASRLKETVRLPAAAIPPLLSRSATEASGATWWNPLTWWKAFGGGSARGTGPASRPAVQGELSLDRIRVVRNDLSDSDVEIVQPASAVKPGSERSVQQPSAALEEAPRA